MTPYPVGTFLLVRANVKHTVAADVDTIIIGTAVGPWGTVTPITNITEISTAGCARQRPVR